MQTDTPRPRAALLVRTKLILGFGILFGFNLGYYVYTIYSIGKMNKTVDYTYDRALMTAYFAQSCKAHFSRCEQYMDRASHASKPKDRKEAAGIAKEEYENFISDLEVVVERIVDAKTAPILKQAQADAREIGKQIEELDKGKTNDLDSAFSFRQRLYTVLSQVADGAGEAGYRQRLIAEDQSRSILHATYGFIGFMLLLSAAVSGWLALTIFRPLRKLREVCHDIEEGKHDFRAPVYATDELGKVAIAFNSMLDQLREKEKQTEQLLQELRRKQDEIELQVAAACAIQQSLLPPLKQSFDGVRVEALYQPCDSLSGDFFDTIASHGWVYVYLADVTSHGMASAQVTYLIKESFRQIISHDPEIKLDVLFKKVRESYVHHKLKYDVGLHLARVNASLHRIEMVRSGAPNPILIEGEKGSILSTELSSLVSAQTGGDDTVMVSALDLSAGQSLYIYTDGAFEFETKSKKEFGQRRLMSAIRSTEDKPWPETLVSQLKQETLESRFVDDVTVVRIGLLQ